MNSPIGKTVIRVALGQFLALCMSVTGLFTTLLVEDNSSLPLLQSITAYCLIFILFSGFYYYYVIRNRKWINQTYVVGDSSEGPTQNDTAFWAKLRQNIRNALSGGYKGVGNSLWRFAAIALIDLEANFSVVFAYRYTDITSVQLLDCSSIIWVMVLSVIFLGARYQLRWHIVGAGIAIVGIVLLIVFDTTNMNRESSDSTAHNNTTQSFKTQQKTEHCDDGDTGKEGSHNILLGDLLCLLSSLLYAMSNVACERLVKSSVIPKIDDESQNNKEGTKDADVTTPLHGNTSADQRIQYGTAEVGYTNGVEVEFQETNAPSLQWIVIIEYLFWMPLFGALFGLIQFWATQEYKQFPSFASHAHSSASNCSVVNPVEESAFYRVYTGDSYVDIGYQLGFGASMFVIYTLMPVLFCVASATFANLSLLTSDIFSIFWNVTIFNIYPKPTFFISFVLILVGVIVFDTNGFEQLRKRKKDDEDEPKNDSESPTVLP